MDLKGIWQIISSESDVFNMRNDKLREQYVKNITHRVAHFVLGEDAENRERSAKRYQKLWQLAQDAGFFAKPETSILAHKHVYGTEAYWLHQRSTALNQDVATAALALYCIDVLRGQVSQQQRDLEHSRSVNHQSAKEIRQLKDEMERHTKRALEDQQPTLTDELRYEMLFELPKLSVVKRTAAALATILEAVLWEVEARKETNGGDDIVAEALQRRTFTNARTTRECVQLHMQNVGPAEGELDWRNPSADVKAFFKHLKTVAPSAAYHAVLGTFPAKPRYIEGLNAADTDAFIAIVQADVLFHTIARMKVNDGKDFRRAARDRADAIAHRLQDLKTWPEKESMITGTLLAPLAAQAALVAGSSDKPWTRVSLEDLQRVVRRSLARTSKKKAAPPAEPAPAPVALTPQVAPDPVPAYPWPTMTGDPNLDKDAVRKLRHEVAQKTLESAIGVSNLVEEVRHALKGDESSKAAIDNRLSEARAHWNGIRAARRQKFHDAFTKTHGREQDQSALLAEATTVFLDNLGLDAPAVMLELCKRSEEAKVAAHKARLERAKQWEIEQAKAKEEEEKLEADRRQALKAMMDDPELIDEDPKDDEGAEPDPKEEQTLSAEEEASLERGRALQELFGFKLGDAAFAFKDGGYLRGVVTFFSVQQNHDEKGALRESPLVGFSFNTKNAATGEVDEMSIAYGRVREDHDPTNPAGKGRVYLTKDEKDYEGMVCWNADLALPTLEGDEHEEAEG